MTVSTTTINDSEYWVEVAKSDELQEISSGNISALLDEIKDHLEEDEGFPSEWEEVMVWLESRSQDAKDLMAVEHAEGTAYVDIKRCEA